MQDTFKWHKGRFNNVAIIDAITFKNITFLPASDIRIAWITYGASSTALPRFTHTIYDANRSY